MWRRCPATRSPSSPRRASRTATNGVTKVEYKPTRQAGPNTHRYIRNFEGFVLNGQGVARAAIQLKKAGFVPDVVCAHPSWASPCSSRTCFRMRACCCSASSTIAPSVPMWASIRHIPWRSTRSAACASEMRACCRWNRWIGASARRDEQRRQYPEWWRKQISLIHDGIDTEVAKPDPTASYTLPDGTELRAGDEVVTYVARNLEPYRGFPTYMRALEDLCRRRPNARFIIVGGDDVSYGRSGCPRARPTGRNISAK